MAGLTAVASIHLTVVVHPIDTQLHPSVPEGWRWAVMVSPYQFDDVARCANAGWCPTIREARLEGSTNAATAVMAVRLAGGEAGFTTIELPTDPIPAGADFTKFA